MSTVEDLFFTEAKCRILQWGLGSEALGGWFESRGDCTQRLGTWGFDNSNGIAALGTYMIIQFLDPSQ